MELILKLFGIGMMSIVLEEILSAQGYKQYSHFIVVASSIIAIALLFGRINEVIQVVLTTFKLQ